MNYELSANSVSRQVLVRTTALSLHPLMQRQEAIFRN